jgi:hypothetical protein
MPTEEEIAEFMETPEGALELQRILEALKTASPTGGALGQGATMGGINPVEEDRRRMMQQLMPSRGLGIR